MNIERSGTCGLAATRVAPAFLPGVAAVSPLVRLAVAAVTVGSSSMTPSGSPRWNASTRIRPTPSSAACSLNWRGRLSPDAGTSRVRARIAEDGEAAPRLDEDVDRFAGGDRDREAARGRSGIDDRHQEPLDCVDLDGLRELGLDRPLLSGGGPAASAIGPGRRLGRRWLGAMAAATDGTARGRWRGGGSAPALAGGSAPTVAGWPSRKYRSTNPTGRPPSRMTAESPMLSGAAVGSAVGVAAHSCSPKTSTRIASRPFARRAARTSSMAKRYQ